MISLLDTRPGNFTPQPSEMQNPSFLAAATAAFNATPARGPYTLAMANSALYLSLPNATSQFAAIIAEIRAIAANATAAAAYLPATHRDDPRMVAGYAAQLRATADLLANPDAPSLEVPWATGTAIRLPLLHPLSRGTVRLGADALGVPVVDARVASNPVDMALHAAHVRWARGMVATPAMQAFGAVEVGPGAAVAADDGALAEFIKDQMVMSFLHPCCTAAMMPESKGGVVGPDLRVHGAARLRVVDMSVLPMLPSAHLSALAYAVGEKVSEYY
jgi:choline dehydrogenase